jgi:hypothetical protein
MVVGAEVAVYDGAVGLQVVALPRVGPLPWRDPLSRIPTQAGLNSRVKYGSSGIVKRWIG